MRLAPTVLKEAQLESDTRTLAYEDAWLTCRARGSIRGMKSNGPLRVSPRKLPCSLPGFLELGH